MKRLPVTLLFGALSVLSVGCGAVNENMDILNPYGDMPGKELGKRDTNAILEGDTTQGNSQSDKARHALEVMGSYRRAQEPQEAYPILQPAEVRLMWVPDHVNKHGDLIPAHYYYLRVLPERWGGTGANLDAFTYEEQLKPGGTGAGGATPWVYK